MPVLTPAIESFLARTDVATPYVVVDLDVVQDPYHRLATALPEATIFYAVKANPARALSGVIRRLSSACDHPRHRLASRRFAATVRDMNPSSTIAAARTDRPSRPVLERPGPRCDMAAVSIPEPAPCRFVHRCTPPGEPRERIVSVNVFPIRNRAMFPIRARKRRPNNAAVASAERRIRARCSTETCRRRVGSLVGCVVAQRPVPLHS